MSNELNNAFYLLPGIPADPAPCLKAAYGSADDTVPTGGLIMLHPAQDKTARHRILYIACLTTQQIVYQLHQYVSTDV